MQIIIENLVDLQSTEPSVLINESVFFTTNLKNQNNPYI
jgi:hypothetical protein